MCNKENRPNSRCFQRKSFIHVQQQQNSRRLEKKSCMCKKRPPHPHPSSPHFIERKSCVWYYKTDAVKPQTFHRRVSVLSEQAHQLEGLTCNWVITRLTPAPATSPLQRLTSPFSPVKPGGWWVDSQQQLCRVSNTPNWGQLCQVYIVGSILPTRLAQVV